MVKKNKKTLLMILAYIGILAVVVIAFVFIMQARNTSSVVEVYYASRDIAAGSTVDSAFEINYISKTQIPKTVASDMEKHGAKPIYSTSQLKNNALSKIPQGTILVESMFDNIVSDSVMSKYISEYGFKNPYYTVLAVDTTNSPIDGFSKDQRLSIEGSVELSTVSWSESFKGDANDSYTGIITNNCVVAGIFTDDDEVVTNIGVVVELADYPTINYFENYGKLKFHDGILDNTWETTNAQIMNKLWEKTGFKDTVAKALSSYIIYYEAQSKDEIKKFVCEYSNTPFYEDDDETIMKKSKVNFLQATTEPSKTENGKIIDTSKVSLYTPYKNFTVTHYDFTGKQGVNMDLAGVNTESSFDSRTGLYNLNFEEEGYYQINFYDKVTYNAGTEESPVMTTKVDLVNQVTFVIEKLDDNTKWDTSSADLVFQYDADQNNNFTFKGYALTGTLSKVYFDALKKEAELELGSPYVLNENIFADTNDLTKINYFFNMDDANANTYLIAAGEQKINKIKLVVGDDSYDLFLNTNLGTIYEKPTNSQIYRLCYALGLPYKATTAEDAYKFYNCFTKQQLGGYSTSNGTQVEGLLDLLEKRLDETNNLSIACKGLIKYDANTGTSTEETSDVAIPLFNYILGSLWANTFDYAKLYELKNSESGIEDLGVSFAFELDDGTSQTVTPRIIVNKEEIIHASTDAVNVVLYKGMYTDSSALKINKGMFKGDRIVIKNEIILSDTQTVSWKMAVAEFEIDDDGNTTCTIVGDVEQIASTADLDYTITDISKIGENKVLLIYAEITDTASADNTAGATA